MRGTCLCGAVVYEMRGPIEGINYCHCGQCRKASGTAFATNAGVPRGAFEIISGRTALRSFEATPGKKRWFCATCGAPIYSEHAGSDTVYVRIGTLDDDPRARPGGHIHVASKAPWYEITDDVVQLQEEEGLWF